MKAARHSVAKRILDRADASLLDLVDHVLDKGVVIEGEILLGLADVDMIYLRLSAILCAADLVLPSPRRRRHRRATAS